METSANLASGIRGTALSPGRGIHRGKIKTDGVTAGGTNAGNARGRVAAAIRSLDLVTVFESAVIVLEAAIVMTALTAAAVLVMEGAGAPAELSS
jgi:hypothetical protein